jgi:hypothetical protein
MAEQVSIEALRESELSEAWALARSSGSFANEDWWVAEGCDLIAGGGGVLAARATDGQLHGVATFEAPKPSGRTLIVRVLITFELSRSAPSRRALLASLTRIATKLGCTQIVLPVSAKPETSGGANYG